MFGPSNGVVTGLVLGLAPGEFDLVLMLAKTAVALFDVHSRELCEFCLLIDGGVIVA
jgi:hypothetical protein